MTKKELQLKAGQIIKESKLGVPAKLQLFNFLKEANEAQIKAFLLDGKIVHLDEQAEEIVEERFKGHKFSE
jgi:hypothetical protein